LAKPKKSMRQSIA